MARKFATGKHGKEAKNVANGANPTCGLKQAHWQDAQDLLNIIIDMDNLSDIPPNGTDSKKLSGRMKNWRQVRVSGDYRILYQWDGTESSNIKFGYFKNKKHF